MQVSAPFEMGITMTAEDFEEYGVLLQEVIRRVLGNTETAGAPKTLFFKVFFFSWANMKQK